MMLLLNVKADHLWSSETNKDVEELLRTIERGNIVHVKFGNSTADISVMGKLLTEINAFNKGLTKISYKLNTYIKNSDTLVKMIIYRDGVL